MGNEGLPVSLVIFILMVLISALAFAGAIAIVVLTSG